MKFFRGRKAKQQTIDAALELRQAEIESRGRPELNGGARASAPGAKAFMVLLLLIGLMVMSILTWRALTSGQDGEAEEQTSTLAEISNNLPRLRLTPPEPIVPDPDLSDEPQAPATIAPELPTSSAPPMASNPLSLGLPAGNAQALDAVTQRRLQSSLRAEANTSQQQRPEAQYASDSGPMSEQLQPLQLTAAKASRLSNLDFLLPQGTMIDCGMATRLVSSQAGMISCFTTQAVRSASGRVVLIDAGTQITGYQQGVLSQGQPRIAVAWSRMLSREGVVIGLNSPGTGPLGEAGLDGHIDTHFAERFGGAIMVSLISDFGAALVNNNGSDSTVRLDNTSSAAQDAVTTVLENSINIPPTLYRNQGGRVGIYVARDLDFSTVYDLRPVRH